MYENSKYRKEIIERLKAFGEIRLNDVLIKVALIENYTGEYLRYKKN